MAYSELNNDNIKRESATHFHDLLHQQLSADNTRNTDHDSAEESGESPLDFSIKRKPKAYDEVSGSESLSSPASSLNDTGGNLDEQRKSDNDHSSSINRSLSRDSPPSEGQPHNNNFLTEHARKRSPPASEPVGQPRTAEHSNGSPSSRLPHMLNELQMGLTNANMLANSFPTMAALMDHRRLASASKGTRPFKAYPSDTLAMNIGNAGVPSYLSSFANFENSLTTQGLNLSSEEIFSIYKQQLMSLRERDKYLENLSLTQEHAQPRTSTVTSSPPVSSLPPSLTSMSMHLSNRNNGINSNLMRDLHTIPSSSASNFHSSNSTTTSTNNRNNNSPSPSLTPLSVVTAGGRRRPRSLPDEQKDEAYWERRRKNNEAAKRSRDARRAKEDQIAIRAALLEQENLKLRVEVAALKTETAKLRCMLYNS